MRVAVPVRGSVRAHAHDVHGVLLVASPVPPIDVAPRRERAILEQRRRDVLSRAAIGSGGLFLLAAVLLLVHVRADEVDDECPERGDHGDDPVNGNRRQGAAGW